MNYCTCRVIATCAALCATLGIDRAWATEADDLAEIETALASESNATPPSSHAIAMDLAFILDVAGAWFSKVEPLQTGEHDPNATGFTFQQLEMSIGASVDPYLRMDGNLVFTRFGVEIEEAYVSTLALPGNLQLRGGQFLADFGRLNPTHPHTWNFVDQPLVNGKFFGGDGSRAVGAEVAWLSPLPWYLDLSLGTTMADTHSFFGEEPAIVRNLGDLLYTGRLEQFFGLGAAFSILFGISAQVGPNGFGADRVTTIYGSDLHLKLRPTQSRMALALQLEGMVREREVLDAGLLRDFGGRAELIWTLSPRWQTGARYEYVTGVEQDPLEPDWDSDRQRVSGQLTFAPSHFSRIRLQSSIDVPEWLSRPVYAGMLNVEVLIGAHASHAY